MEAISRGAAQAAGLKHYFTGKPCKRGHVAPRYVCDKACVECKNAQRRQFAAAHPEKMRAYVTKWREGNRGAHRAAGRSWRERNVEEARAAFQEWYETNRDAIRESARRRYEANREAEIARTKAWQQANPEKQRAIEQRRRARKLEALCDCCTPEDFHSINDLARLAGFEVDHVEPLALGGRHCRHNLQLLTPADHKAKTASDMRRIAAAKRANRGTDA